MAVEINQLISLKLKQSEIWEDLGNWNSWNWVLLLVPTLLLCKSEEWGRAYSDSAKFGGSGFISGWELNSGVSCCCCWWWRRRWWREVNSSESSRDRELVDSRERALLSSFGGTLKFEVVISDVSEPVDVRNDK